MQTSTNETWMTFKQARNRCIVAIRTAKRTLFLLAREKPRLFLEQLKECTDLGKLRKTSLFWPCRTPILSKASVNMINRLATKYASLNSHATTYQLICYHLLLIQTAAIHSHLTRRYQRLFSDLN